MHSLPIFDRQFFSAKILSDKTFVNNTKNYIPHRGITFKKMNEASFTVDKEHALSVR